MPDQLPAIQWGLIAGIADPGGGRRVVFTDDPMSIPANVVYAKGERAFVSDAGWQPMTHEPVEIAAWVVWKGEAAILDGTRGGCGSCRACCITLFVADEGDGFTKPSHQACHHLCNAGCGVYEKRPRTCRAFKCLWLSSQDGNRPMAPELRPDRCGVILTRDEDDTVRLHVDQHYPKSEAMQAFVSEREKEGERFAPVKFYFGEVR